MKKYNVIDQLNNVIATIQVDDSMSVDELQQIYGGTVVGSTQTIQPQAAITDLSLQTRLLRNQLLEEIDTISATRYASLTSEQQTELQAYRRALLAVPQQVGFPLTVEWPAKPIWL